VTVRVLTTGLPGPSACAGRRSPRQVTIAMGGRSRCAQRNWVISEVQKNGVRTAVAELQALMDGYLGFRCQVTDVSQLSPSMTEGTAPPLS